MSSVKTHYVGQPVPYKDAEDKVTGKAVYGMDFTLPGMLYAKVLRSPFAHAKIKKSIPAARSKSLAYAPW